MPLDGQSGKAIEIGEVRVFTFVSSRFRLDGGSMFGVVPRTLWEKKAPPDDYNRILLNVNSLLIETSKKKVLVEPGMGSKYGARQKDIYDLTDFDVVDGLSGLGVAPEEIDLVIPTHLHLDHAGGLTLGSPGDYRPTFPRAKVLVQKSEWEAATQPHPLSKGSYLPGDFAPLEESGNLELIEGDTLVADGIALELTGGHTAGHQVVRISSGGSEAVYMGDIVPTVAHLKPHWLMAWDLFPERVYEVKSRLLSECALEGALVLWAHDPHLAACRVKSSGGGSFEVEEGSEVEAGVTPPGSSDTPA
jgi:glyoxylase-like metal-dependent hydrolase (beta-lactamase superfamily II)